MKDLVWRGADRRELAAMLGSAPQVASSALGDATIYSLEHEGREVLAIAMPGGDVVLVERTAPAKRRRSIDTLSPASR